MSQKRYILSNCTEAFASGVMKVGVTRCGNWWCRTIFFLKSDDLFQSSPPLPCTISTFQVIVSLVFFVNSVAEIFDFHQSVTVSPPGWWHPGRSPQWRH